MPGRRGWKAWTRLTGCAAVALAMSGATLGALPASLGAQEVRVGGSAPELPAGGWIGFSARLLPQAAVGAGGAEVGRAANTPVRIVVSHVIEGSPAARAGLRTGDRIVTVNRRPATPAELDRLVRRIAPGDTLAIGIDRDGWTRTFFVQASRPPASRFVYLPRDVVSRIDSAMHRLDSVRVRLRAMAVRNEEQAAAVGVAVQAGQPPRGEAVARLDSTLTVIHRRAVGDTIFAARVRQGAPVARAAEATRVRGKLSELIELTAAEQATPFRVRVGETRPPDEAARAVVVTETRARQEAPEPPKRPLLPYIAGHNRVAGAELTPLNPELGAYFGVGSGLLVTDVTEGTPAADAGLRGGDVVVRVGEREARDLESVRAALAAHRHGPLTFTIVRERRRMTVTLGG